MSDLVGVREAMRLLGVGATTVKRWADEGRIATSFTAGGHRRFRRAALESLAHQQRQGRAFGPEAERWLDSLFVDDVESVAAGLYQLRKERGSWFAVADFIGGALSRLGERWVSGDCSTLEEHVASAKLEQALGAVAVELATEPSAPVALLATLAGEQHTLGLSLVRVCLRALSIDILWVGANVPVADLQAYIASADLALVGLSASVWSTDHGGLRNAYRAIAPVCEERQAVLLLGGGGAWPDSIPYGHRCHAFADLRSVLRGHGYST